MTQNHVDQTYYENYAQRTYKNQEGVWDIEIDVETYPVGKDSDDRIEEWQLFKILGPKNERFTYKIRFNQGSFFAKQFNLGHKEDRNKNRGWNY